MTDYDKLSSLRKRLQIDIGVFETMLEDNREHANSISNLKRRVDDTLALQFQANLIVNMAYNIMLILKYLVRKGGSDISKHKSAHDEARECLEHYKGQVYNLSQRLSTLREMLRVKNMVDSD